MAEINIPYNTWSKNKIYQNIKTATTRTKKYGKKGDVFIVDSVKYIITDYLKTKLEIVSSDFFREEGAGSPEEFIEVWNSMHPVKKFDPQQTVWIHFFEEQKTENKKKT